MKKLKGIQIPESWEDVTLATFSNYNKAVCDFNEALENLDESEKALSKASVAEVTLNFEICKCFSGLTEEEVYALDIGFVKNYVDKLSFLKKNYEPKEMKFFVFEGVTYKLPESLRFQTKFGQYVEALQAEMNSKYTDKNSVIYLAHQLAHQVDNGKEWNQNERDELAVKFENIPMTVGANFSFFLLKKLQVYSVAYLKHIKKEKIQSMPFMKRISYSLGGLKRYMKLLKLKYSISLIKLRLIVFYVQIREKLLHTLRFCRLGTITNVKFKN